MSEQKTHSVRVPRLYKEAARILQEVVAGGNLKNLIYSKRYLNIKALYALVVEAVHHAKVLDYIIEKSKILLKEEKLDPCLARILISELLWGKRQLPGNSKPIQTVLSYKEKLLKAESCHEELPSKEQEIKKVALPRYVRVNTICKTVEDVVKYFCAEGWQKLQKKSKTYSQYLENIRSLAQEQFTQDFHIRELLVFPPKTDFHDHDLYLNGSILLQDKASCLPAHLLAPEPGSTILDMCAAPGMKTTHLAAIMENRGKIYAIERDQQRYDLLCEIVRTSGATCIETLLADSLSIDSNDVPGVQYILVDPSCSGSGIVGRVDVDPERKCDPSRLYKLAGFQIKLLHHALTKFPLAKKVVYSTCSLNVEENEEVVEKVMSYFSDSPLFKLVKKIYPDSWKNRGSNDYKFGKRCLYSRPEDDLTNGFFITVFERCSDADIKGDNSDKYVRKAKKSKKVSLDVPPRDIDSSFYDRSQVDEKKSKYVKQQKSPDILSTHDWNVTANKERCEEHPDINICSVSSDECTSPATQSNKTTSTKSKSTMNLVNEQMPESFGERMELKKHQKKRSGSYNGFVCAPETIPDSVLYNNVATNLHKKSKSLHNKKINNSSSKEFLDNTNTGSENDNSDVSLVEHEQESIGTKLCKERVCFSTVEKHSAGSDAADRVLNVKKKKSKNKLLETLHVNDDIKVSNGCDGSSALNRSYSKKRKCFNDVDIPNDPIFVKDHSNITDNVVIKKGHKSSLNTTSENLEEKNSS